MFSFFFPNRSLLLLNDNNREIRALRVYTRARARFDGGGKQRA